MMGITVDELLTIDKEAARSRAVLELATAPRVVTAAAHDLVSAEDHIRAHDSPGGW